MSRLRPVLVWIFEDVTRFGVGVVSQFARQECEEDRGEWIFGGHIFRREGSKLVVCMNRGRGGWINDGYSTPQRTRLPFHEHGKKFFFNYLFIFFNIKIHS